MRRRGNPDGNKQPRRTPLQQRRERPGEQRTRHDTRGHRALIDRAARGAPHVFRCVNVVTLFPPSSPTARLAPRPAAAAGARSPVATL